MKIKKDITEKNAELTTEKKLRNVRTCLYILILAAITKLAMTDFTELVKLLTALVSLLTALVGLSKALKQGQKPKKKGHRR